MPQNKKDAAGVSAGHQLGQIIGTWFEQHLALPILERAADHLELFCDSRFKERECRGDKLIWADSDGNQVDYDFVFEMGGTRDRRGMPVAFFETFWRRGSRHSKDKARDDSGKLLGMRDAYPSTRYLGIVAAGDFTKPAQALVRSRSIDLFYVPKDLILNSWRAKGISVDYEDNLSEARKRRLVGHVAEAIEQNPAVLVEIATTVLEQLSESELRAFETRITHKIGATPRSYNVSVVGRADNTFLTSSELDTFLTASEPERVEFGNHRTYTYEVVFGNDDSFSKENLEWDELQKLHRSLESLVSHMEGLRNR